MTDETPVFRGAIVDHVVQVLDAMAAEHADALAYVNEMTGGKFLLKPNE